MSVASHLKDNTSKFLKLFKTREELTFETISLIDVHSSTIVTQCLSNYDRKFAWIRLLVKTLLAIKYLFIYVIKELHKNKLNKPKKYKNDADKMQGSTFLIINTNLAKRELYSPLIEASKKSNLTVNAFCIRSAKSNEYQIEINKSLSFLIFHFYKIIKLLIIHLSYSIRVKPQKSFAVIYSFVANLAAIIDAVEILNYCEYYKIRPNNIVYDDINDPATRIIALYFKKLGIHINVLQFGHYDKESVEWNYVIADALFIWGEYYEKILVGEHNLPKNISIQKLGSPRFDYLFENRSGSIHFQKKDSLDNFYGLVFSTYSIKNYGAWVDNEIINKLKRDVVDEFIKIESKNIKLIIKPHPYESSQEINEWIRYSNPSLKILDQKIDARNLIANASFIISFGSGLTLDALAANKPVLIPNWIDNFPYELEVLDAAGAQLLKRKSELNTEILRSVSNEAVNQKKNILNFVSNSRSISLEMLTKFIR